MTKDEYTKILQRKFCTVVFTKKDGSNRIMNCTLMSDIIDRNGLTPVGGGGSVVPDQQVRCIDTDIMAWRSFNIDSVVSFI
jgi:hypothetical protein